MSRWSATFTGGPHDGHRAVVDGTATKPFEELRIAGSAGDARVVYPKDFDVEQAEVVRYVLVGWRVLDREAQYAWAELSRESRGGLRRRELLPA